MAVRKSQAEQARLGLEQQIVTALAEVETAAIGVVRTQERLVELDNTKKSADRSVELATDLYRSGWEICLKYWTINSSWWPLKKSSWSSDSRR